MTRSLETLAGGLAGGGTVARRLLALLACAAAAVLHASEASAADAPARPNVSNRPNIVVILSDDVSRTLFEEFAEHQAGARSDIDGVRAAFSVLVSPPLDA